MSFTLACSFFYACLRLLMCDIGHLFIFFVEIWTFFMARAAGYDHMIN
jgi:hypothetical protein